MTWKPSYLMREQMEDGRLESRQTEPPSRIARQLGIHRTTVSQVLSKRYMQKGMSRAKKR
jgi:DNA-directed RNA polymerase specialized sigma54-like protein